MNRPGPEAERDREAARGQPERLAGVDRRSVVGAAGRAALCDLEALREARRGIRPLGEELDEPGPVEGLAHVERGEVQAVLRGGDDARLVRAVERVGGCRGTRSRAVGRTGRGDGDARSARRAHRRARRSGPEEAEEVAAADAVGGSLVGHQASGSATPSTVWVSCESGSARALTWSERVFLSASVSSA